MREKLEKHDMSQQDVQLSGSVNTMAVIALVAAMLSLSLNFWCLDRINGLQASIQIDRINAAQAAKKAAGS